MMEHTPGDYSTHGLRGRRYRETYTQLFEKQQGVCAICKKLPSVGKLQIDHCHQTGKVRGLLCPACNSKLGFIETWGCEELESKVPYEEARRPGFPKTSYDQNHQYASRWMREHREAVMQYWKERRHV